MEDCHLINIIEQYSGKIYNLAFRITGNRQDAEDIVQETFLSAFSHLDQFRGESTIQTWLYKIAYNHCLKLKKRMGKAYVETLDEKTAFFQEDIPPEVKEWYADPEKAVLIQELLHEIRNGCMYLLSFKLPENQRVVYILRNILDLSYEEIALILDVSKNIVKARLNRARDNLLSYFGNRCQWLSENADCRCNTRVGLALALDPDLIKRVQLQAAEAGILDTEEAEAVQRWSIDEIYRQMPMFPYVPDKLLERLSLM